MTVLLCGAFAGYRSLDHREYADPDGRRHRIPAINEHSQIVGEIELRIRRWLADGTGETHIRHNA